MYFLWSQDIPPLKKIHRLKRVILVILFRAILGQLISSKISHQGEVHWPKTRNRYNEQFLFLIFIFRGELQECIRITNNF